MDPRTRRLGWGWWALASLALAVGVYVAYTAIDARNRALEAERLAQEAEQKAEKAALEAQAAFDANALKVQVGMTEPQVEVVMGRPGDREGWKASHHPELWRYWKQGDSSLAVEFGHRTHRVVLLDQHHRGGGRMRFQPDNENDELLEGP